MQIVFISQYFYPEQFSNNAIAQELVRRGHSLHVYPCVPNYGRPSFFDGYSNTKKRKENWNGVEINRVWTMPRGTSSYSLIANFIVYPFAAFFEIWKSSKSKSNISFVSMPSPLSQALVGIFLKKWRKVPTVYWVQDVWPESLIFSFEIRNRLAKFILDRACGWIYRQADLVLVQNQLQERLIARHGVEIARIKTMPNTAAEYFQPLQPAQASEVADIAKSAGFKLMFAGNIGESQDFDTLIDATKLVQSKHELSWLIVGTGRDLERVKLRVEEEGLADNFRFLGRHPEERMPKFFVHADALIVSLKKAEIFSITLPYKLQCYLACGRPIIGSLDGVGSEIITRSGAGVCAPASSPHLLAQAIMDMMEKSAEERAAMGESGRRYFETHFSPKIIYDKLDGWLHEVSA
jgi:colanic acid biosynthesis glycosyl transferase WcaI